MNLRDFTYLVAVAEHEHFGKAAEACFVSQPALSMQLKKLEEFLGVMLFERTNKRVMITEPGKKILERAKILLQEAENIKSLAKEFSDPRAGKIIIGAFPTLAPYILPKIIPGLHQQFEKLSFYLVEEKTDILIEKLLQGEIDCALLALPIEEEMLVSEDLFQEDFLLAVPEKNTDFNRQKVSLNDIQDADLLLLEEGHCLRMQALEVCSMSGAEEHKEFRATSLETLRQMVAANVGITLMPEYAVRPTDGVDYIDFESPAPARHIALVWRKTSVRPDLFQDMSRTIIDLITE